MIGCEVRARATGQDIPILAAEIDQRVAYAESLKMGRTIFEWQRKNCWRGDRETNRGDLSIP